MERSSWWTRAVGGEEQLVKRKVCWFIYFISGVVLGAVSGGEIFINHCFVKILVLSRIT